MLYSLAWKAAKRHPYPSEQEAFDEARSLAHVAFMEACASHDPSRASFNTHCWLRVWFKLKGVEMKAAKKATELPLVSLDADEELHAALKDTTAAPATPYFNLDEFRAELGRDARTMLGLLLDTPKELLREISPRSPRSLLKIVKARLYRKWRNERRVQAALRELREQVAWRLDRIDR